MIFACSGHQTKIINRISEIRCPPLAILWTMLPLWPVHSHVYSERKMSNHTLFRTLIFPHSISLSYGFRSRRLADRSSRAAFAWFYRRIIVAIIYESTTRTPHCRSNSKELWSIFFSLLNFSSNKPAWLARATPSTDAGSFSSWERRRGIDTRHRRSKTEPADFVKRRGGGGYPASVILVLWGNKSGLSSELSFYRCFSYIFFWTIMW